MRIELPMNFKAPMILLVLFVFGCSPKPAGFRADQVFSTTAVGADERPVRFRLETVAEGLEVPWGIAFLPDGRVLVTERRGRVRLIEGGKLRPDPVFKVPDVEPSGESGLMDIALHPDFAANSLVYLAYAYRGDGKSVKIVRYRFDGSTFDDPQTIIADLPAAQFHAGTRARFGPDRKLYVTVGDATDWNLAQKTDSLAGKTLRLNEDGTIPSDNPFVGNRSYRPEIFSVGHRNAQGLAWAADGTMYQTEHGPSGFEGRGGGADEFNRVEAGKNSTVGPRSTVR